MGEFTRKKYLELFKDGQPVVAQGRTSNRHTTLVEAGEHADDHAREVGIGGDYEVRVGNEVFYVVKITEIVFDASQAPPAPEVQAELALSSSAYSGNENTAIQFTVLRTENTTGRTSVDWAITNATVAPSSGTVTFEIGESSINVAVTAGEVGPTEVGSLNLSNPQNLDGGVVPALISPSSASFTVVNIGSQAETDWVNRVAAYGTLRTFDFENETEVTGLEHQQSTLNPENVVWDQSDGITGGACLKLLHPKTFGQNAGNEWLVTFHTPSRNIPADESIYVQYAVKFPASRFLTNIGGDGWKVSIMATPGSTFQGAECTQQNLFYRGYPDHYTSGGGSPLVESSFPVANTFRRQTALDASWTETDVGARYCLSHGAYPATGSAGCIDYTSDVWWHFLYHVIRRSNGNADIDVFIHRRGVDSGWLPFESVRDHDFSITNQFSSLHLLTYTTGGSADGVTDTHHKYDQVITSEKMPPAPQSIETPAWFTALTANKWTEIGQSMDTANHPDGPTPGTSTSGTQSCFDAWTGPVMDTERGELIFAANQGHTDGSWNGVISLTFKEETPTWRVPALPSSSRSESPTGTGRVSDNAVISSHAYDMQCYCPVTQKFYFPGRGSIANTNGSSRDLLSTWARYSRGSVDYVRGWDTLTYGDVPWSGGSSDYADWWSCDYDPVTEKVLTIPAFGNSLTNSGMCAIDPIAETLTFTGKGNGGPQVFSIYPSMRCAGSRGLALMLYPNGRIKVWDTTDLGNGTNGHQVSVVVSGGPTLNGGPDIVWHEPSDAFLVRGGTSKNLYKLRPTDWSNWTNDASWGYTLVTTDSSGVTPDAHYSAGSFGKFRIIPDMGNGEACLILIPRETSTPLAMRLTGAL